MRNSILFGGFLCLIASISWGAMFPVARSAFFHIDPFYFTMFRYGSVTIILVLALLLREGWTAFRLEGKFFPLWFFGTMAFTVYNLLIFYGQDLLGEPGVMVASINEALMPMISVVIIWLLYRNRPYTFTLICVLLGFIGVTLVITKGDLSGFISRTDEIIPTLLIFIAVVGWVLYTMGGERFAGWSALRYSTLTCLLGTVTAGLIVALVTMTGYVSVPTLETIKLVSPHILFMIIFPGVIALVGWNVGVMILSPLNGLLFINFVPVTTLIVNYFQGIAITSYDYIGTAFIITALVSNNIFLRKEQTKAREKLAFQGEVQEKLT